jgi:hypothetical protein
MEDYSNIAHLSTVMAAIQYSETHLQNQDVSSPDFEGKEDDEYTLLQNLTKTPIISKHIL